MKLVDAETMRELDQRAIQEEGISEAILMERAGLGIADAVERLAMRHQIVDSSILMLAGLGNNGGDVFVAARYLWERDMEVHVRLAGRVSSLKGAAEAAYLFAKEGEVPIESCPDEADWMDIPEADILVDGLLGTGFSGEPRGVIDGVSLGRCICGAGVGVGGGSSFRDGGTCGCYGCVGLT